MIRQELCVIPILTVAQYLFIGREPTRGLLIDDRRMTEQAAELLKPVGAEFSPDTLMGDLSIAEQQLVEIARALSYPLKLLILDEPTTALGERETERIFTVIRQLKARNVSVIYISHRLEELFTISDRITVMRDGKYITTLDTATTEEGELIRLLAGHDLKTGRKTSGSVTEEAPVVLQVENLSTASLLKNVSFSLHQGEVLGLAGLMGSGRSETVRAICGIDPKTDGRIMINGREVNITSPKQAAEQGICYLSEDRNGEGVIPERSIIGNTVLSSLIRYGQGVVLDDRRMLEDTVSYNERLKTKYSDPHAPISSLSGGNAQKVVIARWLIRDCPIFIFDEPTKGIDVGAKDEIYQIIADIVKSGHSVILISSETDELLRNCDRLVVMCEGRVSGELPIQDATQETIMRYATGGDVS
jgi:ribose transport system ATP-binding protein